MKKIDALIDKVTTFKSELEGSLIKGIVEANADMIADMNVRQLYDKGVNADGEEIMSYRPYAPSTIVRKRRKGQPTDRVTLRDTGVFHGAFKVDAGDDAFDIDSADEKRRWLVPKYGKHIFGLTTENKIKLQKLIKEKLLIRVRKLL